MRLTRVDLGQARVELTKRRLYLDINKTLPKIETLELEILNQAMKTRFDRYARAENEIKLRLGNPGLPEALMRRLIRTVIIADHVEFFFAHMLAVRKGNPTYRFGNGTSNTVGYTCSSTHQQEIALELTYWPKEPREVVGDRIITVTSY